MAEKTELTELAEEFINDLIMRYSYLADGGPEARVRARYEVATNPELKNFLDIFNQEAREREDILDGFVHMILGMITKHPKKSMKNHQLEEYQEAWAICQNTNCDVERTGIGYFPLELPEEQLVFRPENLVYSDAGERFRNDRLYCRGCKLEDIVAKKDARVHILRQKESDGERRRQVEAVLQYVAQNRPYSNGKSKRLSDSNKRRDTLRILVGEFSKYYPSVRGLQPDIDPIVLYPIFEKQAHHVLMIDRIPGWPPGMDSLLKEGILQNINPPVAIVRQNLKTAASFLEKLLESKFSERLPPMDLYRFRVTVSSEEDVRMLKELILDKCNKKTGWSLAPDREVIDYYINPKIRNGKVLPYRSVHLPLVIHSTTIEIQLRTFKDDYVAHTDSVIGEDDYMVWKKHHRRSLIPSPFNDLLLGILEPEDYARTEPVTYLNLLANRLEQEAQKSPSKKAEIEELVLNTLSLETTLKFYDDLLELPELSKKERGMILERSQTILGKYFIPLRVREEWMQISGLSAEQRKGFSSIYLPKIAGTPENIVRLKLVGKVRGPLEQQEAYLSRLGLHADEIHRVLHYLMQDIEEVTSRARIVEENNESRLAKKPSERGKAVYKYEPAK